MDPFIRQLQITFTNLGIPADLVPLMPFALGMVLIYIVIFGVRSLLVRAGLVRWKTASFYLFISPWLMAV